MAILAIKGHPTRGNEVIKILEMLGGENKTGHCGNNPNVAYYISHNNNTILCNCVPNIYPNIYICVDYTLEEFLEKFPYKIGDRVRVAEYESEVRIDDMKWDGNEVQYEVFTDETECYSAKELNLFNTKEKSKTDEHPNKDLKRLIRKAKSYDKLVSKGFVNIERVCEWLSDNMKNYAAFDSDMIKDLKKAME